MADSFLGHFLVAHGYITSDQLQDAVSFRSRLIRKIGRTAVEKGLLTDDQVELIIRRQHREDGFFAELAERSGFLTKRQSRKLISLQKGRHLHLGEALVALGHLSEMEFAEAIPEFLAREKTREKQRKSILDNPPGPPCITDLIHALENSFPRVFNQPLKLKRLDRTENNLQPAGEYALKRTMPDGRIACTLDFHSSPVACAWSAYSGSLPETEAKLTEVMLLYLNNALRPKMPTTMWRKERLEAVGPGGVRLKFSGLTTDVFMTVRPEEADEKE
ncbi:MAG: hypothetical protein ACOC0U_06185 [Desulfovibrionales bacterium]